MQINIFNLNLNQKRFYELSNEYCQSKSTNDCTSTLYPTHVFFSSNAWFLLSLPSVDSVSPSGSSRITGTNENRLRNSLLLLPFTFLQVIPFSLSPSPSLTHFPSFSLLSPSMSLSQTFPLPVFPPRFLVNLRFPLLLL